MGTGDRLDRPREIAVTNDGTRAYVTLSASGRVALVDRMALQQVDTNPETKDVIDPIDLGNGAAPHSIVIDSTDDYAYIDDSRSFDGGKGLIYVLNINPNSDTYNQVVAQIQVDAAPFGLRGMAISSDGRRLFVTAPNTNSVETTNNLSHILVINIDPEDRPTDPNHNQHHWR